MTARLPITRCQYCGSDDLGEGWQHGDALVTFKYHGMLGNRLRYLICRRCGFSAWLSRIAIHRCGESDWKIVVLA